MGLEVSSCTRARGSVPRHGRGLGHRAAGRAVLASHTKGNVTGRRKGGSRLSPKCSWARGHTTSCQHQAGKQSVPFYLQNDQPRSVTGDVHFLARKKQGGGGGREGVEAMLASIFTNALMHFLHKAVKCLSSLQCCCEKGETSQRTTRLSPYGLGTILLLPHKCSALSG